MIDSVIFTTNQIFLNIFKEMESKEKFEWFIKCYKTNFSLDITRIYFCAYKFFINVCKSIIGIYFFENKNTFNLDRTEQFALCVD